MRNDENFDWVTALSSCSVAEVFVRLKQQVKDDIEQRNKLLPHSATYNFKFIANGETFMALIEGNRPIRSVTFKLGKQDISVRDESDTLLLTATLTFNDEDGQCRFRVKERELCSWQVRKMALEGLLFGPYLSEHS